MAVSNPKEGKKTKKLNTDAMFSSNSIEWETPRSLFNDLDKRFQFNMDVCASPGMEKCVRYFSPKDDGLSKSWSGYRCWMNPPYGKEIKLWVKKAYESSLKGTLVVGLLPARTDTKWWQAYVAGHADVRFLRGRLKFGDAKNSAPFPSAIVIWWGWDVNGGYFSQPIR